MFSQPQKSDIWGQIILSCGGPSRTLYGMQRHDVPTACPQHSVPRGNQECLQTLLHVPNKQGQDCSPLRTTHSKYLMQIAGT